jgi:hypothetical protein
MNLLLPLFSLLLFQAGSIREIESTWPADFNASLSGGGFHQPEFYDGWQAGGSVGANWYLRRPLVDDGSPLAMQAFLQRLNRLSFNLDTVGFGAKDSVSLYEHSGHSANVSLSGLFYLRDMVLGGGIHYERVYDFQHPSPLSGLTSDERHTTQLVYPDLTLGVRWKRFEGEASYRFKTYFDDGKTRSPRWGQALLRLQNFSDEQIYWSALLYTVVHGAGLSFDFEFFSSPRLGVWLKGYLDRGVVYANSENDYRRESLSLGVGWWKSNRLELQFSVGVSTAQRESAGSSTLITGLGTFGVVVRAPRRDRTKVVVPLADPVPGA